MGIMTNDKDMISDKALSRDDLFLMMKSYENSVQQNAVLLNQQQKLLEQQETILNKQGQVCNTINSVAEKLATCGDSVSHIEDTVVNTITSFGAAISKETQKVSIAITSAISDQTNKMVEHRSDSKTEHISTSKDMLRDHSRINLRIYGVYALLTGVVITLVTLIVELTTRMNVINKIAQHFGLS